MVEGWFLLPLIFAVGVGAAALTGPSRAGRTAGTALATANLAAPLLVPAESMLWRFLIGMYITVAAYFREHLLWPFARRRRAALGMVLAFVASGVLHGYIVIVSVGAVMSLYMTAFFLAQIALVLFERRARIRDWPRPAARVWTIGSLLALSPLFVEPAIRVWDPILAQL